MIKIGNLNIESLKVGSGDCTVYLGTELIYSGDTPTPPAFQVKWLATYNGGTTASAECDASSAITNNQITKSNLVSVEIGDCVTSIGNSAFEECSNLTSIDIPSGVTSIGNWAFGTCDGLISCTIGSGVTSIGYCAFVNCTSLTSINIPNSVTNIGNRAFGDCRSLTSCTIGSGVTSIGEEAFAYCTSLTSITVNATTPPTLSYDVFYETNNCPIYVPSASVDTYKAAWSDYRLRIQAIPNS